MGRSIAYLAAKAAYRTILEDLSGQLIGAAVGEIRATAQREAQDGLLSPTGVAVLLARVEPESVIYEAAGRADLIIEAAPDDLETKTEVYTLIDRAAPPRCIFAATTSAMPISEIASMTYRMPQVLAMLFSDPIVPAQRLEILKSAGTSEESVEAARQVGIRMGKQVVVVEER